MTPLIIFFSIQMNQTPDGVIKLEIEHAKPSDCGAYKLVISNPNGDVSALCAVAVKRKLFDGYCCILPIC